MNYEIFDTNAILLGLLSAMLAAECMILLVKTQSMRHKMKSVIDNVSAEQKHRLEERKKELEEEMKDRARTLESEYRALLEETRKNNQELEAKIRDASYSIEKSRLSARQAADEAAPAEALRLLKNVSA